MLVRIGRLRLGSQAEVGKCMVAVPVDDELDDLARVSGRYDPPHAMFKNLRSIVGFALALAALPAAVGFMKGIIGGKSGGHVLELVFSAVFGLSFGLVPGGLAGVIILAFLFLLLWAVVRTAAKLSHRDPENLYTSSVVDVFVRIFFGLAALASVGVCVVATGRFMSVISDLVADGPFGMRVVIRVIVFGYAFVLAWALWLAVSGDEDQGPTTATSDADAQQEPAAGSSMSGNS